MKSLAIKLKRKFSQNSERSSGSRHSDRTSSDNSLNSNNSTKSDSSDGHSRTNRSSTQSQPNSSDHSHDTSLIVFKKEDLLEPIPSFREVTPEKRKNLFVKKLRLCHVSFDFESECASENLGKEMKRQILLELVDHVTTNKGWFSEKILREILNMVSANLFRALKPSHTDWLCSDEDEPQLDQCWPHLQIVYEFLLRFIVSTEPDPKLLKRHLNGSFILNLLHIFHSEDPREREYLKTILHRIYGKFMSLRSFIRKSINNVFYTIIYCDERHNGVGELLEILGSIINGFALPVKMEHKRFLHNVLIPLHKTHSIVRFHQQLSYCMTQFIDKDSSLSSVIIAGLIRFWPVTSATKEVLLLNELEEIIEMTPIALLKELLVPMFTRLAKCVSNQHFQVSERALFFWNNDLIGQLTQEHKRDVFSIVVPALNDIKQTHWNTTVHSLATNVTRMLVEIDTELYTQTVNLHLNSGESVKGAKDERRAKWQQIQAIANATHKTNQTHTRSTKAN